MSMNSNAYLPTQPSFLINSPHMSHSREHHNWIDFLRIFAIFLVIVVHSTEPFYLGGRGTHIETASDTYWVSFFDSFARACVPLFVIASSYLLLPLSRGVSDFFKRRVVRVVIPFLIWTIIYASVWGNPATNFYSLLFNFNYAAGHLWFVYMLLGIYLIIPILSPWAQKVSRRQLFFYIAIFLLTTLIPFIRESCSEHVPVIYGPTGIPNPAKYPLWGECSWNSYGMFYYISGFIGYVLIGLYFRRFAPTLSWGKNLLIALPVWLIGFCICFWGFVTRVFAEAAGVFPIEGPSGMAAMWETPWINDTIGVVLMAIGWITILRKINFTTWLLSIASKASYGVYLCHMLILAPVSSALRETIISTPVTILLTAIITFILSTLLSAGLQRIPYIGKYIVG